MLLGGFHVRFLCLCLLVCDLCDIHAQNQNDRLLRLAVLDQRMRAIVSRIVKIGMVVCVLIRLSKNLEPHALVGFYTCSASVSELPTNYFFGIWPVGICGRLQVGTLLRL